MESSKSRETTATRSSPGSPSKGERPRSPAAEIPGPSVWETLRRLSHAPFLRLPGFLSDVADRYGPVVAFHLPWRRFVLVNDADAVKDVLVTQQHAFVKSFGARALRNLLGDGLLTSEEPKHRQMRRIVQPAFHRERIARYAEVMRARAQEWTASQRAGRTIDMAAEMSALTLRIAGETLFGIDTAPQAEQVRDALDDAMETYPAALGPFGPLMRRLPFVSSTRRFESARKRLDAILYDCIDERRRDVRERDDVLSLLLLAEDAETGARMSDEEVRDEAMTLLLAGHETTANALVWTWFLLARNPQIESRFHAAVDAGDSDYVRRVLRESMRLYPPAWILGREAVQDVTLAGGYRVGKGTTVFVCPLVLHRAHRYFEHPLTFDPDRWLGSDIPPFAYVPFGGGARRCIGEEFAWTEGVLVLSEIGRRFRFSTAFDGEPPIDALVTLRPHDTIAMEVHDRS